jgi:hypothetical protein
MLHPLIGCYSFFGRNRQRPQNHRTLVNLMFPSVCLHLSQSRKVTPCLLLKVTYLKSTIVAHSLSLKVIHSLPGKGTDSLSLKVAHSLLKVAHSLSLKVTP